MHRPSITLEQLRIFVGVAEREHVTRAAEALHITQSAASAAISAIEGRHRVKLFDRVGRRIELTEAGRALLEQARALLGSAERTEQMLAEFGGLARGTLRLVASQTIASYWLPPRLAQFHARYPGIAIELAIANTEGAMRHVLDGAAELGFAEGEVDDPAVATWRIARDRLCLVGPAAMARPEAIDAAWIAAAGWIVRERGSGTRSSFEALLAAQRIAPEGLTVTLTLPSNEAIATAVEAGAGVAVLPELVAGPAIAAGRLRDLGMALPERAFFGLRHKERYRRAIADALLEFFAEA